MISKDNMTMKTGVTADKYSDLYHWIKLYFKVYQLCIIAYMYNTSDAEKSENSSHDHYRTSEHNETNAHWRMFFRLFCKL